MMIQGANNCVRLIVKTAALVLCIYQIAYMLNYIIRGETRTRLRITQDPSVELPNVYLCFSVFDILNVNYFREKYPSVVFQEVDGRMQPKMDFDIMRTVSTMTFEELSKALLDPSKSLVSINPASSVDDVYQRQVFPDDCKTTNNLIRDSMCIKISCTKNGSAIVYDKTVIDNGEAEGYLMQIKFNQLFRNVSTYSSILVIPMNKDFTISSETPLFLDINFEKPSFEMIFGIKLYRTEYKESDFTEQCTNYRLQGYQNRIGKVHQCINNLTRDKLNCPYYETIQPLESMEKEIRTGLFETYLEFFNPKKETREFYRNLFKSFKSFCYKQSPYPDCEEIIFRPYKKRISYGKKNESTIVMRMTSQPTLSNIIVPYYDLDDFIVYSQSAIGIWLGISPIFVIEWLIDKLITFLKGSQSRESVEENKVQDVSEPADDDKSADVSQISNINVSRRSSEIKNSNTPKRQSRGNLKKQVLATTGIYHVLSRVNKMTNE
uniref:Uncharacterized protein n=1 Tax=Tetranychus urticae TaxID=32264 RepID=T1K7D0_TETUR